MGARGEQTCSWCCATGSGAVSGNRSAVRPEPACLHQIRFPAFSATFQKTRRDTNGVWQTCACLDAATTAKTRIEHHGVIDARYPGRTRGSYQTQTCTDIKRRPPDTRRCSCGSLADARKKRTTSICSTTARHGGRPKHQAGISHLSPFCQVEETSYVNGRNEYRGEHNETPKTPRNF